MKNRPSLRAIVTSAWSLALLVCLTQAAAAQLKDAKGAVWYIDWSLPAHALKSADDPHGILAVVPSKDLGFPVGMEHVLRVTHPRTGPVYGHVVSPAIWPNPKIGETRYFRVYFASWIADDEPSQTNEFTSHHPLEDTQLTGNSAENWQFETAPHTNADRHAGFMAFVFGMLQIPDGEGLPGTRLRPGPDPDHQFARLQKFLAYRFEWAFTKTAPNIYRLEDFRIYDPRHDQVPAYDKWTMIDNNGDVPLAKRSGARYMTDGQLNHFWLGTNGGGNFSVLLRDEYDYWGGLCVRSDSWCGPYVPGEAGQAERR